MIENKSKKLSKADDSAAELLMELLQTSPGRNFDIESIFVERKNDGWRFIIFEFLKAVGVPPEKSHPRFYWDKNKRKFLSLWTLTNVIRKAGYEADLLLINYDDARTLIKHMIVLSMDEQQIITEDKIFTFREWAEKFRNFNNTKKGDTWELLSELLKEEKPINDGH